MPAGSCVRSLQLGRFLSARSFTLHPTCPAPRLGPAPRHRWALPSRGRRLARGGARERASPWCGHGLGLGGRVCGMCDKGDLGMKEDSS